MKKTWTSPQIEELSIAATKLGTDASEEIDATTYDACRIPPIVCPSGD